MHALQGMGIKKAYFISPIVNMQILIEKMMSQACVSEEELRNRASWVQNAKKNFRENIFATPESILSGWRRCIFYMAKTMI
jgi:hydrolase